MSVNALLYDTDSTFFVAKAEVIKLLQHLLMPYTFIGRLILSRIAIKFCSASLRGL